MLYSHTAHYLSSLVPLLLIVQRRHSLPDWQFLSVDRSVPQRTMPLAQFLSQFCLELRRKGLHSRYFDDGE